MREILIVKIAAIGDVTMALSILTAAKEIYPTAKITWICGKQVASLLEQFPEITKIICVDEKKLLKGSLYNRFIEILAVWREIFGKKYDLIVMGHADVRYKILTCLVKTSQYRRFSRNGRLNPVPGRHHSDEYVRLLLGNSMNVEKIYLPPVLSLNEHQKIHIPLLNLDSETKKIIVLSPGGAKNLLADDFCRRWPIERYVGLANNLVKRGYRVFLIGAVSDSWIAPYFVGVDGVLNIVGKTDIMDLLYLFSCADLLVTHDSGPMHLAGLVRCGIVALFGPTNPYEKVPRYENVRVLWHAEQYTCCPCYDGKTYAKCKVNACLQSISVGEVMRAIDGLLLK